MTKSKKEKTEPKVGEDLTEPLSAVEIAQRELEAKKDAEAAKPAKKKGLLASAKKEEKTETPEETAAAEQVEANEIEQLKAELQEVLDAGPKALKLAEIAAAKGFTGQSSNLKMIGEACKQMANRVAKEKDFLTYTKKGK